jgi:hypothetical protein
LWFQKKRWKCEIPIGSNVKQVESWWPSWISDWQTIHKFSTGPPWMVIYKICVFGTDRKSNMAARAHNVFWLVEILKIFLLETTKPIELWQMWYSHRVQC